jgi:aminopeptidase-like protein
MLVTPAGLEGGLTVMQAAIEALEVNRRYLATVVGEPQLGKRGLYPTLLKGGLQRHVLTMMNFLAYADGEKDLLEISEIVGENVMVCAEIAETMLAHGLVSVVG